MIALSTPDGFGPRRARCVGGWEWPAPAAQSTLTRCVLLALLLHLWAVLLVGNVPGGSARPGEGVGGAINVTLRGPGPPAQGVAPPPMATCAATRGSPGHGT